MRIVAYVAIGATAWAGGVSAAGAQVPSPAAASPRPAASAAPSAAVNADDVTRSKPEIDRIDGLWRTGGRPSWFADSFLANVPFASIGPILDQVRSAVGAYRATVGSNGVYSCTFEHGTDQVHIHLDASGKVDGLFLSPPQRSAAPAAAAPAATATQAPGPHDLGRDRVDALWSAGPQPAWFADSFVAKVPLDRLAALIGQVKSALGAYRSTVGVNGDYLSTFANGTERVQVHLDGSNKIDSFFVFEPHST